jgi:hypothetical protein
MQCTPPGTLIAMFAGYNIVAVFVSVAFASVPIVAWRRLLQHNQSVGINSPEGLQDAVSSPSRHVSFDTTTPTAFVLSVLGSAALSFSAPFLAALIITREHQDASYWTIVQQWATRPRSTVFVLLAQAGLYFRRHISSADMTLVATTKPDGHIDTAMASLVADLPVSLLGLRFLFAQQDSSSSSCDSISTSTADCPTMATGADGLSIVTIWQAVLAAIVVVVLVAKAWHFRNAMVVAYCSYLVSLFMFIFSWELWSGFLQEVPEELYCVPPRAAALLDVLYFLLPLFLGLWRLACIPNRG